MAAAASQPLTDSYTWGFTGAPIQIHLDLEVVSGLRKQIQHSEKGSGELSACGLLTGETHTPGVTRILNFTPLDTLDAASVEAAKVGASDRVVGFYRTIPTGRVSMPDDDRALAASLFCHPSSVFMFVETEKSTIGAASFCFWGEGEIFDWPLMVFPFDAAELAIEEERRHSKRVREPSQSSAAGLEELTSPGEETQPPPEPVPVSLADRGQESRTPQPVAERRQASGGWWLALALAAVVAAVLAGASLYVRRGSNLPVASQAAVARTEVQSPLGLSVERHGNDLRVSWNGSADRISKADFGMLLIRGSAVSRDVPLTAEELRAGSVVYVSPVDQVRFQLTVVAGGQVTREFLTIVVPEIVERSPNRASLTSSLSGNSNTRAVLRPPVSSGSVIPLELRQFKKTRDPATATPPRIDEPPPVSGAAPVDSVTPSLLNRPAVSPGPPQVSINQVPVSSLAPVDAPAQRTPQGQPSLSTSEAQPPVATHRVVPNLPIMLKKGAIWTPTTVDVNVSVDASGSVVKAEVAAKSGLHPLLRDAAVQAALQWKFQPARYDGHPLPANIVLQFRFFPKP